MNKYIREGKVAVIYNSDYGSGLDAYYYGIYELLFDPKLVEIVLHPDFKKMCSRNYNGP